jgi:acyl-coenzyme A synthetase/AMP-(fatty) acid ligase
MHAMVASPEVVAMPRDRWRASCERPQTESGKAHRRQIRALINQMLASMEWSNPQGCLREERATGG